MTYHRCSNAVAHNINKNKIMCTSIDKGNLALNYLKEIENDIEEKIMPHEKGREEEYKWNGENYTGFMSPLKDNKNKN